MKIEFREEKRKVKVNKEINASLLITTRLPKSEHENRNPKRTTKIKAKGRVEPLMKEVQCCSY